MSRERPPIFSPKFPLRSITFSQMAKIFRSGASPFQLQGRFLHVLPFRRPSFSKFLYLQAVHRRPWPAYCSQPMQRLTAGRVPARRHPWATHAHFSQYLVPETPLITTKSVPETSIFTLELAPEPPIFQFAATHIPTL